MSDHEKECGKKNFDMIDWWEERTTAQKIRWGIGFAVMGSGLLALFGLIVMLLWNWLMPEIFGLRRIDFLQAWGLLVLSSILFKGFHFGSDESSRRTDRRRRNELRRYIRDEDTTNGEPGAGEHRTDDDSRGRDI